MCGRFGLFADPQTLARHFGTELPSDLRPRYNIAPTQNILIVREELGHRRFAQVRWGLIPHWAKEMNSGYSTINARSETVDSKPMFRDAFRHRRCLIPADGFFEWEARPDRKIKQPWFITLRDREPMAFAGIWERWHSPQGEELESCSIIVIEANEFIRPIHDRMPVVLPPDAWANWFNPVAGDVGDLKGLLKPYRAEEMAAWHVNTGVNNVRNDTPECVRPVD